MADDHDRDLDLEIIQKSLTTAHLEIPNFEPQPTEESPSVPTAPQSSENE